MCRIFTHVGIDPRLGGGVAAYVLNLSRVLDFSGLRYKIYHVSQFSVCLMLLAFIQNFRFRGPVILNSCIHPFSLLMILFSRSDKLIVMPHGEFLDAALAINKRKKTLVLNIIKYWIKLFGLSKSLTIVASTEVEVFNFSRFFPVVNAHVVPDVINFNHQDTPRALNPNSQDGLLHIVMIGRMVRMKGFAKVLSDFLFHEFSKIDKISLYYLEEDRSYFIELKKLVVQLQKLKIRVDLYEGRNSCEIYNDCKDSNCILIVPSEFESFSYVLVENLWMPNKPIVSFDNPLTSYLLDHGHCRLVTNGGFVDAVRKNEIADKVGVMDAMNRYASAVNKKTIDIIYGDVA